MSERPVRNLFIFLLILSIVFFGKMEAINALFAIGVGVWTMVKSFNLLFGPAQDFDKLPADIFFRNPRFIMFDLLYPPTRKPAFFVLIWWSAGILATIVTYKLLSALLTRP